MSDDKIKRFVKKTLGCGCPEEVFQHIDCQYDLQVEDVPLKARINVGNRLLIYVAEVSNTEIIAGLLAHIIGAGKKERDQRGFNRFRLVLAAEKIDEIKPAAERLFNDIDNDDKVHLHVIPKADIPLD